MGLKGDGMDIGDKKTESTDWPSEIRVKDRGRSLSIMFAGGAEVTLSAALLRFASPSVEPQQARQEDMSGITIVGVEPVGNYAVQLAFDDGHKSGIYSWDLLHGLASTR